MTNSPPLTSLKSASIESSKPSLSKNVHFFAITIFEIPHIVRFICDSLTPKDIWNCYRVSTTWCGMFDIHRYRNVRFADLPAAQTWDILENAHYIRTLEIGPEDGYYFLREPISSWPTYTSLSPKRCSNLRELRCINLQYKSPSYHFLPDGYRSHRHYDHHNILNLVRHSPKLQRLTMDLHCMDNRESLLFSGQFLKPFSELRFLQYLKVDGEAYIQQMHELLHHLPSSLEELELSLAGDFLYDFYETRDVTIPTTNLRRLIFSAPMPWYAILLLKQSPLLEDVTLSTIFQRVPDHFKVLVDHCPRIHSIQFHEAGMLGNSVLPMISEYSELRALSLGLSFYSLNQRLEFIALLGQLTNTLESLRLSCSVFGIGENLGKMLRTFPNLRVVELGVSYPQPRGYGIHLYDLLHDRNKDSQPFTFPTSQHIPWACHSLEVFRCRIDTSFGHVKVVSIEDEAKLIGQFYQELKTLRRLIHLDLAWNQWRQHHGLHMPREVGLQFMIQHGQPEKYRMSKGDLLWMNLHWPSLAEVEEQEAMEKLRHVSENEKSGCKTYQSQYDQDPYGEFAKNPDVEEAERKLRAEKWAEQWCPLDDWPSQANKKVLGKSGKSYIHRPRSSKHQIAMSRPLGEFYSAIKYTPVSFHYVPKSLTINVE